jgi:hypothetical protein
MIDSEIRADDMDLELTRCFLFSNLAGDRLDKQLRQLKTIGQDSIVLRLKDCLTEA